MIKTLLVIVFIIINPNLGKPGEMMADFSYVPTFEQCRTASFDYTRRFFSDVKDAQLYGMMCVELTEEEDQDPINAGRKIWLGLPTK